MSDVAIRAEGLGKCYKIGAAQDDYPTLREMLTRSLTGWTRRGGYRSDRSDPNEHTIWALDDVSFEVRTGEAIGIIGRNGAGKSTLLKILSRITEPTRGWTEIRGRVGSLLEVGTGFHPELTGRENIYLSAAILGMSRADIARKFDEIVSFAEVEKFLDTPIKRYSSGMHLRLAFAVAANLEPDVLLVDEVLAVGDLEFQKKCLGKMEGVAGEGRTVLFVSHNLQAVSTLTRRTILLDRGRVRFQGETAAALHEYRRAMSAPDSRDYLDVEKQTGVIRASVLTSEPNGIHRFGEPLTFVFDLVFREKPKSAFFSFHIRDETQRPITHFWLSGTGAAWSKSGAVRLRCIVPRSRLYMGNYSLTTHVSDRGSGVHLETTHGICPFEVVMDGMPREYRWLPGNSTYLDDADWEVTT